MRYFVCHFNEYILYYLVYSECYSSLADNGITTLERGLFTQAAYVQTMYVYLTALI